MAAALRAATWGCVYDKVYVAHIVCVAHAKQQCHQVGYREYGNNSNKDHTTTYQTEPVQHCLMPCMIPMTKVESCNVEPSI